MISSRAILKQFLIFSLFMAIVSGANAQGRLILNGAKVNLSNGANLVISNASANGITRNSGHIISEGENNAIKWNIGTTSGSYVIPWGYGNTDYLPVSFVKSGGVGSGYMLFSTYRTATWQNSSNLPTGVTNFNGTAGVDNSAYATDRFWQINPIGYSTNPTLTTLVLTYLDSEFAAPNNSSSESRLTAQRYNNTLNSWNDFTTGGVVNTVNNTVTIASIDGSNVYRWWAVSYPGTNLHWVGAISSLWNDAANWSTIAGGAGGAGVPSGADVVIFDDINDTGCTLNNNMSVASLVINSGYTGTITQGTNTIDIAGGATLSGGTFSGGSANISVGGLFTLSGSAFTSTSAILDLKSDLTTTSGSFIHNNGTVRFSGTATQNINGSLTNNFNNINVTNTANPGVSIESNQNLIGVLDLASNVIFDADGAANNKVFTLISSADSPTRDGAIGILPSGAQVTGSVTVQRFMTKEGGTNTRIYRYISSPVQNATVADIQNEIPVTGTFTGTSTCTGCATNQSMFSYQESVITDANGNGTADFNDGYADFPDATNTEVMAPGRGYTLFVRGNVLASTSWDVRGTINAGNVTPVTLPVSYTSSGNIANDGWNLVGNPFPSTIDWNAASGWTKTNLDGAIYTTDNGGASQRYTTWNGVTGTNGGSRYIATGQAFWVKGNGVGAPSLQANENVKAPGTQTTFFRENAPDNLLRVTLVKGTQTDETVIHFRQDATPDFDKHADAKKLANATLNLSSTLVDGSKLAINSLAALDCASEIKLAVDNVSAGSHQLKFTEFESFPASTTITLRDNFSNTTFDARQGTYTFNVTADPKSQGANRFSLMFSSPVINTNFSVHADAVCADRDAMITIVDAKTDVQYELYTSNDILLTSVAGSNGILTLNIDNENLKAGQNDFKIKAKATTCSAQVSEKPVSVTIEPIHQIAGVTNGKHCKAGAVTLTASGDTSAKYNWYEAETSTSPIAGQHGATFVTPSITKTKTYYVSATNALGCEGSRVPVVAEIVQYEEVTVTGTEQTLTSSYAEGNQWFFGNVKLNNSSQTITPDQSGTYSVVVTVNGCTSSGSYDFIIMDASPEVSADNIVKAYPNPVQSELNVEMLDNSGERITDIKISDASGHVLHVAPVTGLTQAKLSFENYPTGIYIVTLSGKSRKVNLKIIKN
ncbi:MAG: T9SS type A sorting domain-containing protein [Bacteroidota bacterium]